jgi:phosphoribosylcarboxyaminoimidazole (NCAIR) mutase
LLVAVGVETHSKTLLGVEALVAIVQMWQEKTLAVALRLSLLYC